MIRRWVKPEQGLFGEEGQPGKRKKGGLKTGGSIVGGKRGQVVH